MSLLEFSGSCLFQWVGHCILLFAEPSPLGCLINKVGGKLWQNNKLINSIHTVKSVNIQQNNDQSNVYFLIFLGIFYIYRCYEYF